MGVEKGILTVGDKVKWRGGFGADAPKVVKVVGIEITEYEHEKDGTPVDDCSWADNFIVDLDNGHWAYSTQLKEIK